MLAATLGRRLLGMLVLPLLLWPGASVVFGQGPRSKTVLLFYPHEQEMASYAGLDRGLRSALQPGSTSRVEFYTEYLDFLRFPDERHRRTLVEYLRAKYSGRKIDLILVVSSLAFEFVLERGEELFPGIPIVFTSVNVKRIAELSLKPNITGIAVQRDYRGTLEVILRLQPKTARVVIPVGTSPREREWASEIQSALQPLEGRVAITYLTDLSMDEILSRLKRLPPDTAVLFSPLFFYDAAGRYFLPEESLPLMSEASSVPVYGTNDHHLGGGIVGGALYDMAAVGAAAGRVGQRILSGEPLARIPVQTLNPNLEMFDARQLARWGIAESRLPAGSIVRFREPGLWRDYRGYVLAAAAIGIMQALLIGGLLFERRRRRGAEVQARRHLAAMAHLDRRAAMGELTASLAHELNQPLGAILHNAEAAELMLGSDRPPALGEIREILADIRKDDVRAGEVIRRIRSLLKKQELEARPLDVNDMTSETVALVAHDAAARGVRVDLDLSAAPTIVNGDRVHLQQVLLNLVRNAMEAMAQTPPESRRVLVRTARNDGYVEIAVKDAGQGIRDGAASQIFEPFFTTKPDGMGMGLSISRSIVEAHGGRIAAQNNPAGGATFSVRMPRHRDRAIDGYGV